MFFSCRAPAKTAVRHLSPRGGGGDRQLSDARHPPGLFFLFSFTRLGLGFQSETDRTLCFRFLFNSLPHTNLHTVNPALVPLLGNTVPLKRRSGDEHLT